MPIAANVRRAVFVGTKVSYAKAASTPARRRRVRTVWGEIATALEAYAMVREDDERATNPGDILKDVFNKYAPCLILIDEWVAYARQLHGGAELPAGTFDTQFTFAQALSEAAKAAKQTLLVVSIPASESLRQKPGMTDFEIGGERGREWPLKNAVGASGLVALDQLGRGFEIVPPPAFQPLTGEQFIARDSVSRAFSELYGQQPQEFPLECREGDYERRMKMAYPIHAELFDRLYNDWSTLEKFQRTRGVLRLMAAVIHSLWGRGTTLTCHPYRPLSPSTTSSCNSSYAATSKTDGPGHRQGRRRAKLSCSSTVTTPTVRCSACTTSEHHHLHGLRPDQERRQ